jgi:hypothetical protein
MGVRLGTGGVRVGEGGLLEAERLDEPLTV